jgi:hypothetical protein
LAQPLFLKHHIFLYFSSRYSRTKKIQMIYIDLTEDDAVDLLDKDIEMEEANLVDLTGKDCEMNDADSAAEFVIGSESVRFVPFVKEAEVPVDFIPICPTPVQSSSCDKVIMEKSKQRYLDNLTILKAFSKFDYPNLFQFEEQVNCIDLESEIFSSGKIYFLCKLFKLISQRKGLVSDKMNKFFFSIIDFFLLSLYCENGLQVINAKKNFI